MNDKEASVIAESFARYIKTCYARSEKAKDETSKLIFDAQLSALCFLAEDLSSALEKNDEEFKSAYFLLLCGFKNTRIIKREGNKNEIV